MCVSVCLSVSECMPCVCIALRSQKRVSYVAVGTGSYGLPDVDDGNPPCKNKYSELLSHRLYNPFFLKEKSLGEGKKAGKIKQLDHPLICVQQRRQSRQQLQPKGL